jgi:glycosyltransferase involved in cell wall biosynthesis
MDRLRILVLAPDANPDHVCGPLIGFSQAQALAKFHDITLAIRPSNEEAVRGRPGALQSVEAIRMSWVERSYTWGIRRIFKSNFNNQLLQAFAYPFSVAFEWQAWRQMRARIKRGEFDIVLRLLPVTTIRPSPFAFFLRNGPVPFVIGPVNGGLPWPQGFKQARTKNKWLFGLRKLYPFLPFARSTYRRAAAIIAGSSHTYAELAVHREKLFFLPENGIDRSICVRTLRSREPGTKLELIFIGSLIPWKACDLALRGAATLLRDGLAHFTVVGDGVDRAPLEQLTKSLGVEKSVLFCGVLKHDEVMQRMGSADVLVFPSMHDFGGGVVFEALALGVVPVVADFGGPGDIVHAGVGRKVSLTNETDVVSKIEEILHSFVQNREVLERLRLQGLSYARERLSWDAKAKALTEIMQWVLMRGPKPNLPPPRMLHEHASARGAASTATAQDEYKSL